MIIHRDSETLIFVVEATNADEVRIIETVLHALELATRSGGIGTTGGYKGPLAELSLNLQIKPQT